MRKARGMESILLLIVGFVLAGLIIAAANNLTKSFSKFNNLHIPAPIESTN